MKLVLAEKPSVAQSIAKVLGAAKREDGYLEGNGYVVSWCVGHLVELAQPEVYDAKYSKWAYADLPIFPMDWQYEVSAGTKKQFGILKKLMGDLAGVPKAECRKRIDYYLKKTSLIEHRKKKMKQLSGGMKRRVGLVQALLNEPEFLIVDEPTTGLDPEERIRIRNLLVDFSENRTVLFSTHVVEDLAATCNQLAIMHKGRFLYAGSMKNLTEEAQGKIWICKVPDERKAREVEQKFNLFYW